MAQAECITTAIRELMSRRRASNCTSPRPSHIELIAGEMGAHENGRVS
jgi:hypothetical protein